jgi:exodeoxyribonuclease V alpha subunit
MNKIEGYIKKIYKCVQQDDNDDERNEDNLNSQGECNNSLYFILVEIIDKNNQDHVVKGYSVIPPEKYDYMTCIDYKIIYNKEYDNNNISADGVIKIDLPHDEEFILDRLLSLKIPKYGKSTLTKLIQKYKQSIWDVHTIIHDKSINEEFIKILSDYINKKINNEIKETSYILNYLIDTFNLSLTRSEYKKIQTYINPGSIKFPLEPNMNEILVLNLSGCINIKKLELICSKMNLPDNIHDKIKIVTKVRKGIENGHSCIMKSSLSDINNLDEVIKELLKLEKFIDLYEDFIYDKLQLHYELYISRSLKKYNDFILENTDINETYQNTKKIIDYNKKYFNDDIILNEQQNNALFSAYNNPISIITGGPGFGKTHIIKKILAISKEKGFTFIVLGPTGKIVDKIYNDLELTDNDDLCNAYTIHKFVNINYKELNDNDNHQVELNKMENNKMLERILDSNFIIIDEMSMISNKLFYDFFKYIFEKKILAKLIFIGDVNQLPSIDCGSVLNCLIRSKCFPVINLTQPMRNKDNPGLVSTIESIKNKEVPKKNIDYQFVKTNNKTDFSNKFMNIVSELIMKDKEMNYFMIISPTHKNIKDHSENIRKLYFDKNDIEYSEDFIIGDHIILTKNIYMTQQYKYKTNKTLNTIEFKDIELIDSPCHLFNGMKGKIIDEYKTFEVKDNYKLNISYYIVKFDNGNKVKFEKDFFNQKKINKMSYINTVHKYQGSENKTAIVILTKSDEYMASNNLIYTAMSRAKQNCIVIGEEEIFINSIKKRLNRMSNLNKMIITECSTNNQGLIVTLNLPYINKNIMSNKPNAIPTFGSNNILYRSRIEAKWSLFFEFMDWEFKYEPFDLNGYIPDFLIIKSECNNIMNLLVEVKSDLDDSKFFEYYSKSVDAGWEGALLILNHSFSNTNDENLKNGIILGKIYFPYKKYTREVDLIIYKNEDNEYSHTYKYNKKYYNSININCNPIKEISIINNTTNEDNLLFTSIWNSISNQVQYKKPEINCKYNNEIKINNNEDIKNQIAELKKNKLDMINNYNIDCQNINVAINEYNEKEYNLFNKLEELETDRICFYCNSDINNNFLCIQHNNNNLLDYNNCFFVCKWCNKLSIKVEITKNYNKKGCFNCNGCEFCIKGLPKKPKEPMYIISLIKCLHCDNNVNYNYNDNINININNVPKTLFNKKINDAAIKETIDNYKDNIINNIINNNNTLENNIISIKKEIIDVKQYISELNNKINNININHKKSLEEIEVKIEQLSEKIIDSDDESIASLSDFDDDYDDYNKCYNCGQPGHYSKNCTNKKKINSNCYKCGKQGHYSRNCRI